MGAGYLEIASPQVRGGGWVESRRGRAANPLRPRLPACTFRPEVLPEEAFFPLSRTFQCRECSLPGEAGQRGPLPMYHRTCKRRRDSARERQRTRLSVAVQLPARDCAWCGRSFVPLRRQRRYCGSECRRARDRAQAASRWLLRRALPGDAERFARNTREKQARRVGLSAASFADVRAGLLVAQVGSCGICRRPFVDPERDAVLDHDHSDGRIRGLLCHGCNTALGHFGDCAEGVESVLLYLQGSFRLTRVV